MPRGYSDEEKQAALDLLDERGIWAAVEASGAHHTTIYRWHAERVRSAVQTSEEAEAEESVNQAMRSYYQRRLIQVAMAHVDRSDVAENGRDAQAYATAAAILHDKFRLEMGEATARTEELHSPRERLAGRVDELEARRRSKSA